MSLYFISQPVCKIYKFRLKNNNKKRRLIQQRTVNDPLFCNVIFWHTLARTDEALSITIYFLSCLRARDENHLTLWFYCKILLSHRQSERTHSFFSRIWIMSSSWYIDINLNLFSITARLPLCLRYNEFTFRRGCKICYLASGWFLIITLNPFLLCLTSVALVFAFWLLNFTIQGRTRLYVTGKKFTQHYCSPARADILPTDKKKNVCAEVKKN